MSSPRRPGKYESAGRQAEYEVYAARSCVLHPHRPDTTSWAPGCFALSVFASGAASGARSGRNA